MACLVRMIKMETPEAAWVEVDTMSFPTTRVCMYPCLANLCGLL